MSRWQWLSTTGCGSGSGAGGRSRSRRAPSSARPRPAPRRLLRHARQLIHTASGTPCNVVWNLPTRTARDSPGYAVDGVVDLALGDAGGLATSAMASLRGVPAASRSATAARQSSGSGPTVRTRWRPGDDEGHLAADAVGGPGDEVGERAAAYLLVGLGQLAADRGRAVGAERLGHRGQGGLGAVRGLEEHHGALLVGQVGEPAGALARLARQEALEAEPVDRQPRHRERGQHRRRTGYGDHVDAGLERRGDQPVAGVGDARHAGVGHQQHPLAGQQRLDQGRRAGRLVALEVGDHPAADGHAEVAGEPRQPPGVLGGDHVGRRELVGQPRRRVVDPSDRGRSEHQHAT